METRIKTALDGFRKSVLDAHGMDFLIVGSLALHELGMETAEPHDIDMEVKCTPEQEQSIFKLLSDSQKNTMYQMKEQEDYLSNAERRMDKVTWKHKPYLFQWGDVIINVWVVSEFSHEYVTLDSGIKFAKVMSVIRKKIAYQRNKDRAFLINLAYRFLSHPKNLRRECPCSGSDDTYLSHALYLLQLHSAYHLPLNPLPQFCLRVYYVTASSLSQMRASGYVHTSFGELYYPEN